MSRKKLSPMMLKALIAMFCLGDRREEQRKKVLFSISNAYFRYDGKTRARYRTQLFRATAEYIFDQQSHSLVDSIIKDNSISIEARKKLLLFIIELEEKHLDFSSKGYQSLLFLARGLISQLDKNHLPKKVKQTLWDINFPD